MLGQVMVRGIQLNPQVGGNHSQEGQPVGGSQRRGAGCQQEVGKVRAERSRSQQSQSFRKRLLESSGRTLHPCACMHP